MKAQRRTAEARVRTERHPHSGVECTSWRSEDLHDSSKLTLTILGGGLLLGATLGHMASPAMQFAAHPDWRERYRADYSAAPDAFVDPGPQDLTPLLPPPGYGLWAETTYRDPPFDLSAVDLGADSAAEPELDFDDPSDLAPADQPSEQTIADAVVTAAALGKSSAQEPAQNSPTSPNSSASPVASLSFAGNSGLQ